MRSLVLGGKSASERPTVCTSPEPFFFELLRRLGTEYESLLAEHAAIVQENAHLRKDTSTIPCGTPPLPFESLREALRNSEATATIRVADLSPFRTPPSTPPNEVACATEQLCLSMKRPHLLEPDVVNAESDCGSKDVVNLVGNVEPPKESQLQKGIDHGIPPDGHWEVCDVWLTRHEVNARQASAMLRSGQSQCTLYSKLTGSSAKYGDLLTERGCFQKVVRKPSDTSTSIWDLLSLAMIMYDCVFVPLQAFPLQTSRILVYMDISTSVFWSLDIFASLTRGFYTQGVVEMRFRKVAAKYARTWMPIDICVVLLDWLVLMWDYGPTSALEVVRMRRLLRMTRALRVTRLLRDLRIASGTSDFIRNVCSDTVVQVCAVAKLLFGIVVACHFIACGWYAVGALGEQEREHSWVQELRRQQNGDFSLAYAYSSALHWSITQFTPASMEVVPRNVIERVYAICTVLFALVAFSSLVSTITNTLTHLRKKNFERSEQLQLIWRYITEKKVSVEIGNRVYTCYQHHTDKKLTALHASDIPALQMLPETLSQQLSGEVFRPVIRPHPVFHHYYEVDAEGLEHICHNGISELSVTEAQSVFGFKETSKKMFFLVKGALVYTDATPTGSLRVTKLKRGAHFCEMPVWVKWTHRGRMNANRSSELVVLDCSAFHVITLNRGCFQQCRDYAALYLKRLTAANSFGQDGGTVPTDIWYDFDSAQDMVHKAFGSLSASTFVSNARGHKSASRYYFGWLQRAVASAFSSFASSHSETCSDKEVGPPSCCMCCRRRSQSRP